MSSGVAPSADICAAISIIAGSEQADGHRYRHIEQTSSKK
jgi:hypothetical protein